MFVSAMPLFFLRSTTEPFDTPKLSLLLIGVGISVLLLVRSWPRVAWSYARALTIPAAAVLVPLAVSTALSPYRSWELIGAHARYAGLIPYSTTVAVGFLVAIAFTERIHILVWSITASAMAVGGYAILQMFGGDPLDWFSSSYVASTLGHSNFSGAVLAIGLPLGVSLWMQGGRPGWVGRLGVVVIGVALIGSFSQGAWISAAGGTAVAIGLQLSLKKRKARKVAFVAAALVALALVIPVIATQVFPTGPFAASSAWTRGLHWRTALVMAADSPLVGHGANSYALEASRYRSPAEAMTTGSADDPHSVPLGMIAHSGVAGGLGFIVLVIWLLRRLDALPSEPGWAGLAGAASATLLVALVTVDHLVLRTLFWAVLGGIATYGGREIQKQHASQTSRWHLTRYALVPVGVAGIVLGAGILRADIHAKWAVAALDTGNATLARSEFDRASGFGGQWEQRRLYGDAIGRAGFRNGVSDQELTDLRHAFEPLIDLPNWTWRAAFAHWLTQWSVDRSALTGAARAAWNDVLEVNPHDPSTVINLADLALLEGRPASALATLDRLKDQLTGIYPPGVLAYPDYWGVLAIARQRTGDEAGALAALATAESLGSQACHTLIARALLLVETDGTEDVSIPFSCSPAALALLDLERTGSNLQ